MSFNHKRFLASKFQPKLDKPAPIVWLDPEVVQLMLDNYYAGMPPERGLFICTYDTPPKFTAIDNSTGDMWMEDFGDRFAAEKWLRMESGSATEDLDQ